MDDLTIIERFMSAVGQSGFTVTIDGMTYSPQFVLDFIHKREKMLTRLALKIALAPEDD